MVCELVTSKANRLPQPTLVIEAITETAQVATATLVH